MNWLSRLHHSPRFGSRFCPVNSIICLFRFSASDPKPITGIVVFYVGTFNRLTPVDGTVKFALTV